MSKIQLEFEKKYAPLLLKYKEYKEKANQALKKLSNQYRKLTKDYTPLETWRLLSYASKNKSLRPFYKEYKKYSSIENNYSNLLVKFINKFVSMYGIDAYYSCLDNYEKKVKVIKS